LTSIELAANESLAAEFSRKFGKSPRWIARAPGRVNLIGEHTDYNDGYVLPMAIERYTTIMAAPNESNTMTFRTCEFDDVAHFESQSIPARGARGHWSNYPRGVAAGFMRAGYLLPGLDALVSTNVPIGGGLSSSAALEVATATLLEEVSGRALEPMAKAELCQTAEHEYAGMPCGIMDQFISTLGQKDHLMLLDCRSREVTQIEFRDPDVMVLIMNSGVKHELVAGEYATRRQQCERACAALGHRSLRDVSLEHLERASAKLDPIVFRRARHVVTEIERTASFARYAASRDWCGAGALMYASHESLKNDFAVSCAELDALVEISAGIGLDGGVYGCRMTGGGFGGCAVALVKATAEHEVSRTVQREYARRTGITAAIFGSRPAAGASALS
jgi:galactokinase